MGLCNIFHRNLLEGICINVSYTLLASLLLFTNKTLAIMKRKSGQSSLPLKKTILLLLPFSASLISFSQSISGTVTDAERKPAGDATVPVKGTRRSALTDNAGKFSMLAIADDVLLVS
jgi:hypothetical protein